MHSNVATESGARLKPRLGAKGRASACADAKEDVASPKGDAPHRRQAATSVAPTVHSNVATESGARLKPLLGAKGRASACADAIPMRASPKEDAPPQASSSDLRPTKENNHTL